MSVLRKSSLAALALLFVATTAQAVSYTVTLTNGTSFETRYRPMTAEWDTNFAMLRTDQGNWIALKKSEIVDVASSAEVSGFGFQIDETTVFLGWSATEGFVGEDGSGDGAGGAAPPGTTAAPAGSTQAAPSGGGSGSGSGFTMEQFVTVPSTGVIPGGIPLGGGASAGGTEAGLPARGGSGG